MKQNMLIQKCRERLAGCIALAVFLFVVGSLGFEFFTHYKTSNTISVVLQDTSAADVLIILSEAKHEKQWERIYAIILNAVGTSSNIEQLNENIPEQLKAAGFPVIAFSIDRQKNIIYKRKGSKSP